MRLEAGRAAVLAVDLQRGFLDPDGFVAQQGRDVADCRAAAAVASKVAAVARRIGLPVIWTRYVLRADYADGGVLVDELRPGIKAAGGLRAGTREIEIDPGLGVDPADEVIDKQRYSAFFGTRLELLLRSRGIGDLVVAGVTTSMCVETTVRDAAQRDYRTFVVEDGCADFDRDRHQASLSAMAFGFARVIPSAAVLAALEAGSGEF
jgi:ureidoacrylate peracid hydrolase